MELKNHEFHDIFEPENEIIFELKIHHFRKSKTRHRHEITKLKFIFGSKKKFDFQIRPENKFQNRALKIKNRSKMKIEPEIKIQKSSKIEQKGRKRKFWSRKRN